MLFGWSATQSVNVSVSGNELALDYERHGKWMRLEQQRLELSIDAAIVTLANAACTQ